MVSCVIFYDLSNFFVKDFFVKNERPVTLLQVITDMSRVATQRGERNFLTFH